MGSDWLDHEIEMPKRDNPFYPNYVFKEADIQRAKIKWYEYPFLLLLPTFVSCSDGYAWFYKYWHGQVFLMKYEPLDDQP